MERNCKNCKNQDCFWVGLDDDDICDEFLPKTNADRIRSMADEELAKFIIGTLCYIEPPYMEVREKALRDNELLEWLKEEVSFADEDN